jgi:hypothetical protein
VFSENGMAFYDRNNKQRFFVNEKGCLMAWSKSFVIDHPTKHGKQLVHGCLEGPENGLYFRGTIPFFDNGNITVVFPEYFSALVDDYSLFVGGLNYDIVSKESKGFVIAPRGDCIYGNYDFMVIGANKTMPIVVEPD